jgi:hypothetical protein
VFRNTRSRTESGRMRRARLLLRQASLYFKGRLLKQSSYVDFCYSSAPKETAMAPATLECRKVASHEKQSCGYGLSRSACLENTGCCWHVDPKADTYCYKTRISQFSIFYFIFKNRSFSNPKKVGDRRSCEQLHLAWRFVAN